MIIAAQDQIYKGQTNIHITEPIRYPTQISPARPPVLIQMITADFQLSHEAWNKLSSQMSKMAETSKLSKRAVRNTYKKWTSILRQPPKKTSNDAKTSKKVDKTVKIADKSNKDSKDTKKTLKVKLLKLIRRKTLPLI